MKSNWINPKKFQLQLSGCFCWRSWNVQRKQRLQRDLNRFNETWNNKSLFRLKDLRGFGINLRTFQQICNKTIMKEVRCHRNVYKNDSKFILENVKQEIKQKNKKFGRSVNLKQIKVTVSYSIIEWNHKDKTSHFTLKKWNSVSVNSSFLIFYILKC